MPNGQMKGIPRLDEIIQAAVAQGQAPGVVAAVARGDETYIEAAGTMAVDGPPMREDTLFRISSTTKPITAAVILGLIEDGLLRLDEPVDRLVPELAGRRVLRRPDGPLDDTVRAERPVTVRDLLTFTWGFGMQGAMFSGPEPWPIVAAVGERELGSFGPPAPVPPRSLRSGYGGWPSCRCWPSRASAGSTRRLRRCSACWPRGPAAPRSRRSCGTASCGRWACATPGSTRRPGPAGHRVREPRRAARRHRPAGRAWSRPPRFPDGAGGLVSTAADLLAFGRMLLRGGGSALKPPTVAEMTRDQLTPVQRARVWPGFSFLGDRGWGYGVSVLADGSYAWEGGLGTTWVNVPGQDLAVVVLTQRAADETGLPAVGEEVLSWARSS